MNSITLCFFMLIAIILSAQLVLGATPPKGQLEKWLATSNGYAAKQLKLVHHNAVNSSATLDRFVAASTSTESVSVVDPPTLVSWITSTDDERVAIFQKAVQQGRVQAVATNATDSSKVLVTLASSSTASYAFIPPCTNPLCLKVAPSSSESTVGPFALLSSSELTDYINTSLVSGAVQSSVGEVDNTPVVLLSFQV
ncbi:unnamed protein product [Aphanomyces euteiches]